MWVSFGTVWVTNKLLMATARNHTVDFLKCICIVGVVLHHCSNRRLLPEVQAVFSTAAYLSDWCVIAFIGLSGFLEGNRAVSSKDLVNALLRDITRLLVPFVFLTVLYAAAFQVADSCGFSLRSSVSPSFAGKLTDTLLCREGAIAEQLYFLPLLYLIRTTHRLTNRGFPFLLFGLVCYSLAFVTELHLTGFNQTTCLQGLLAYALGFESSKSPKRTIVVAVIVGVLIGLRGNNWQVVIGFLLATCVPLLKVNVPMLNLIGSAAGTIFAYHTPILLQSALVGISRFQSTIIQTVMTYIVVCTIIVTVAVVRHRLLHRSNQLLRMLIL